MYLLRWRFDFADRPSIYGMWSQPGPGQHTAYSAWNKNKEGLIRASIEGKNVKTREISTLTECDGHEFNNFKWQAIVRARLGTKGTRKYPPTNIGLILVDRNKETTILFNGEVITANRSEEDKQYHYATFGR